MADPVTAAVVRAGLISAAREMKIIVTRSAYSSIIHEGQDVSCAVMSSDGLLVAMGEDNPAHIIPVPRSVAAIRREFSEIETGDAFLHNDPYDGGTHLNDVTLVFPVGLDGRVKNFIVVRAHWGDVGGMVPGSISGEATEIFQEGVRIPPLRIMRSDLLDEPLVALLLANMRLPEERRGDLNAMLGTARVGAERVVAIMRGVGEGAYDEIIAGIIARGEQEMRAGVDGLPRGTWRYSNYLDPITAETGPLRVQVSLQVHGGDVVMDFSGTAPEVKSPTNASSAAAATGAFIVLKALLTPLSPINGGQFLPIRVSTPKGSLLDARPPAACGGFGEVRRAVEGAVMGALAQALPERVTGDLKGGGNHVYVTGDAPRSFVFYEYPAGGTGAWRGGDGSSAVRNFTEGDFTSIQPVESLETEFPLRVERCDLRVDSGGPGQWRGGLGIRRHIRIVAETACLSVLSDKNVLPPYGVCGGGSGAPNRFTVIRDGGEVAPSAVPGKVTAFPLRYGDIVVEESAGGGGYGDPFDRNPQAVREDVRVGYLTREGAERDYGVVLTATGAVDGTMTTALRRKRPKLRIARGEPGPDATSNMPRVRIGRKIADSFGVAGPGYAELVAGNRAAFRVRLVLDSSLRGREVVLDEVQEQGLDEARLVPIPEPLTRTVQSRGRSTDG